MTAVTEKRVFLDITVDSQPVGRIEIKLYTEEAPKTCENFRALCTGEVGMAPNNKFRLHYKGNQIHRIVKKFMIQGGDLTEGDGRGGYSVYGRYFDDEKFKLKHEKPYLLSMANKGPNSNSSQFFITTAPAPHCNGKHVVFGEVIKGQKVVDLIEDLEVDEGSKPKAIVEIFNCGELIKKQKKAAVSEECRDAKQQDENSGVPETRKSWLYRYGDNERGESSNQRDDRRRNDYQHQSSYRRRRSRSRSRSRQERGDRHRDQDIGRGSKCDDNGIRVRGRGGVRFRKERSQTPEHWRQHEPKKYVPARSPSPQ